MFDTLPDLQTFNQATFNKTDPLQDFAADHREALVDAAALLAGRRGARIAQAVLDELEQASVPSRSLSHRLQDLLDILLLEHVHDLSREEAGRFASIDPNDPCVEEICMLADGLSIAIEETKLLPEVSENSVIGRSL